MSVDPNEIVKVYAGPLVVVEAYQQVLKESGIESRVVGTSLTASFGTAIPNSIELWVHQGDAEKAVAAIRLHEEMKGQPEANRQHPRPADEHGRGAAPPRKEPHLRQDPLGE